MPGSRPTGDDAHLGAAYPFIAEAGLGRRGVVIGDDLLGGSFVFDPFELYAAVWCPTQTWWCRQIGRGRVRRQTFLWRQAVFGRGLGVDPRVSTRPGGAWGVRPVASDRAVPSGSTRLDPGPTPTRTARLAGCHGRRRMELLSSLASACLAGPAAPASGPPWARRWSRPPVRRGATVPVSSRRCCRHGGRGRSLRTEQRDLLEDGRDVRWSSAALCTRSSRHVRRPDDGRLTFPRRWSS